MKKPRRPRATPLPPPVPPFRPYELDARREKGGKHRPARDEHLDLRHMARELARLLPRLGR